MAKFIFIEQLSSEALAWLEKLDPVVDNANLSESVLKNKIETFFRKDKIDDTVKEYLIEVSVLSLSIAQSIIKWLPSIKSNNGEAIFTDEKAFTNLLLDKFSKASERTAGYQAAHNWIKSIKSKPLSTFSLLWSKWVALFSNEITTAKHIINAKVDNLLDINSLGIINDNVYQLVEHAKNHTDILEALINRQNSRSFFSLDDYDEKYLTADHWFALLLVYKDNSEYRKQICDILLKPQGLFSFSEKTSLAYTGLKEKHYRAIQNASWTSLGLLNTIYDRKKLKQETQQQVEELVKQKQEDKQKIEELEKKLEQQSSNKVEAPKRKTLFPNVDKRSPAGVVRKDLSDNVNDDNDDAYQVNANVLNKENVILNRYINEASDDGGGVKVKLAVSVKDQSKKEDTPLHMLFSALNPTKAIAENTNETLNSTQNDSSSSAQNESKNQSTIMHGWFKYTQPKLSKDTLKNIINDSAKEDDRLTCMQSKI